MNQQSCLGRIRPLGQIRLLAWQERHKGLDFSIKNCVAWSGNLTSISDWQSFASGTKKLDLVETLPELKQVPAMQRRRLSVFAKLALHSALEASGELSSKVASVFASRHGDLQKTSKLIKNVAEKEVLSPTQFGLSVHNAVGGLFSIYTKNKAPQTAISSGEDTLLMAIVDATSKLNANDYDNILVVYTETKVPEIYENYVSQDEVSISIGLLLEKSESKEEAIKLKMEPNQSSDGNENPTLQAIDFLRFYFGNKKLINIKSKRHSWTLTKN